MTKTHIRTATVMFAGLVLAATSAIASPDHHDNDHSRGRFNDNHGRSVERAVPRAVAPRSVYVPHIVRPSVVHVAPYRPYVYRYRPGFSFGFSYGRPYYYGNPYPYAYPVPPLQYTSIAPGYAYGGVRIQDAPRDAQVFADGYYMGVVNDFDGVFQHMNLVAGPHHIEIRTAGLEPVGFDVRVEPGETITYHAEFENFAR